MACDGWHLSALSVAYHQENGVIFVMFQRREGLKIRSEISLAYRNKKEFFRFLLFR